ncbi:hypothetical protein ACFQ08_12600, partial [Streptosporangium algeriense]
MAGRDLGVNERAARVGPMLFVRLKLRLIAGNLRGNGVRLAGFVFTVLAALVVAGLGFAGVSALRFASAEIAADVGVVLFTVFVVCWAVGPLLVFGLDDTLDPSRLALLPLRTGRLAAGMFAASITGVWPISALIVMSGAIVGIASGIGGVLLGIVAVLLQFALCIVTSRLVTTSLSGAMRTRRGRDVLAVSVILFVLAGQVPNLLLNGGFSADPGRTLHAVASVLRWTPPGL